ncbi:MAG: response regulator [Nitrospirae bacterium]|nr:MAG: response regulator [Nitrospirota bacterium]
MKVLVVDDEQLVRWFMERALLKKGFTVKCTHSVDTALEILGAEEFDAVFTDLKMPEENGAVLVNKLRDFTHPPVTVVCSAYITEELEKQFRAMGVFTLKKPFKLKELEETLNEINSHLKSYR